MKTGELVFAISANIWAASRMLVSWYKRGLNYLQKKSEAQHPQAAAPLITKRQAEQAEFKAVQDYMEQQKAMTGSATLNFSPDGKVQLTKPTSSTNLTFGQKLNSFICRHPSTAYVGAAMGHTLLYFLGRRALAEETVVESAQESVGAASLMLGVATYEHLKDAYQKTEQYKKEQVALDRAVQAFAARNESKASEKYKKYKGKRKTF
ncbi:MAG: hypothetical protein JSS07_11320 [Proteobacteria bacterium]|nr:hypothetical protein [Pseudomonadota bacterium]